MDAGYERNSHPDTDVQIIDEQKESVRDRLHE